MKKVSTVRTEQSRSICQQRLTIGLDLGDRKIAVLRRVQPFAAFSYTSPSLVGITKLAVVPRCGS